MKLEEFVKQRREQLGLSQLEISMMLKYRTVQMVSNWENGRCSIPPEYFGDIAKLLKLNVHDMIGRRMIDLKADLVERVMRP